MVLAGSSKLLMRCSKDTQKKKPRFYRVMLHNDTFNKREYVVQVLLKVVKVITVDDAVNVMQVLAPE